MISNQPEQGNRIQKQLHRKHSSPIWVAKESGLILKEMVAEPTVHFRYVGETSMHNCLSIF